MSEVPFGELLSAGLEASAKLDADVAQIRLDLAVASSQTARAAAKRRELELQHSSLIKTNASQTKLLHSLLPSALSFPLFPSIKGVPLLH